MDLNDLQDEVSKWASHNFPNAQPWEPLLGAAEEIGELCHAHLKMHQGIRGTEDEHRAAKCDAIGDVLICLAHYCHLNGIGFQLAVETAWKEVKQRDWQKNKLNGQA